VPLDAVKVALAVQDGLSTVCATCSRYWEGRDRGLPGDSCTARTPCGSPLMGDDFHEYAGPLSAFDSWCFICGDEPACTIGKPGSQRRFGVCARHKQMLPRLTPVAVAAPPTTAPPGPPPAPLVNIGGELRTLENLLPRRKPTVWERIAETEAEFEKIDRERGLLGES